MSSPESCRRCGALRRPASEGGDLCPVCLMELGLESGLEAGTHLGPYEIVGLIGAGGMGEVYRARDFRLRRDVALKVLHPSLAIDVEHVQRLSREARAAGGLNHPNILAVFDVGAEQGVPYVVSELLEGESLRERLARGPLPYRKALEYAVQIALALGAAHEK